LRKPAHKPGRITAISMALILALYLAITTYNLRMLPAEWYGDISIEHRVVLRILSGGWPWRFDLSAGPAYHYLVAAFAVFLGPNYLTYKVASVATGLGVVILLYFLGKELSGPRLGLIAACIGATSFWLVLFARLGSSPQIFAPLLSAAVVYFLLRCRRTGRWTHAALSMAFAGLGLFTYPSTFLLPLLVLVLMTGELLARRWFRAASHFSLRTLAVAFAVLVPFIILFIVTIRANPAFSQGGYVGSKIEQRGESLRQDALTFGKNMLAALGMFQFTGDRAFRTNLSRTPMLDTLSGVLFDAGLIGLFYDRSLRSRWPYLVLPILLLIMPSAAPGIPVAEIPSASRSLGAAPFVCLLVALGLDFIWKLAFPDEPLPASPNALPSAPTLSPTGVQPAASVTLAQFAAVLVIVILLAFVAYANLLKYFNDYAWGLPEHNQPWGLLIAQYIDSLPADVNVRLTTCCWGDAKMPDSETIYFVLQKPQGRLGVLRDPYLKDCADLDPRQKYALIFRPYPRGSLVSHFKACFPQAAGELHLDALGQPAFYTLRIP
jgi:hypothetical protein